MCTQNAACTSRIKEVQCTSRRNFNVLKPRYGTCAPRYCSAPLICFLRAAVLLLVVVVVMPGPAQENHAGPIWATRKATRTTVANI